MIAAHRPNRAFTLVETVLALAIAAILLTAVQSIVFLSARSIPSARNPAYTSMRAGFAFDRLDSELRTATMVITATSTVLELYLPDRDGDGLLDRVRYEWSGTAGAPVTRRYASTPTATYSDAEKLIEKAELFEFVHDTLPSSAFASTSVPETLLASFEPTYALGLATVETSGSVAQTVTMNLPPTALTYKVTRVAFNMTVAGTTEGKTTVALSVPLGVLPNVAVLTSVTVSEDSLSSSLNWIDFSIPSCPDQLAAQPINVALTLNANSPSGAVLFQNGGAPSDVGTMSRASTGLVWTAASGCALAYRVYGTFTTATKLNGSTAPRYVGCTIRIKPSGSGNFLPHEISYRAPNLPEAP